MKSFVNSENLKTTLKKLFRNDIDGLKTIRRKNELFSPNFQKLGQKLKIFEFSQIACIFI